MLACAVWHLHGAAAPLAAVADSCHKLECACGRRTVSFSGSKQLSVRSAPLRTSRMHVMTVYSAVLCGFSAAGPYMRLVL